MRRVLGAVLGWRQSGQPEKRSKTSVFTRGPYEFQSQAGIRVKKWVFEDNAKADF
jgi:hypothetical protein